MLISEALQRLAGDKMRSIMSAMTSTRFTGILTGVLVTALIQSSSATTVMVVSFVNAGLMNLVQSISVIMGANIGTTVTAWIISLFGFKFNISDIAIPLIAFAYLSEIIWAYLCESTLGLLFCPVDLCFCLSTNTIQSWLL